MNTQIEAASAASETYARTSTHSCRNTNRRLKRRRERNRAYELLPIHSPDGSFKASRELLAMIDEWIKDLTRKDVRARTRSAAIFIAQKQGGSKVLGRSFAIDPHALSLAYPDFLTVRQWRTCIVKMCEGGFIVQLPRKDAGDRYRDGSANQFRFGTTYHSLFARRHSNIARAKKRLEYSFASSSSIKKKESTSEGIHSGQFVAPYIRKARPATGPSKISAQLRETWGNDLQGSPSAAIADESGGGVAVNSQRASTAFYVAEAREKARRKIEPIQMRTHTNDDHKRALAERRVDQHIAVPPVPHKWTGAFIGRTPVRHSASQEGPDLNRLNAILGRFRFPERD